MKVLKDVLILVGMTILGFLIGSGLAFMSPAHGCEPNAEEWQDAGPPEDGKTNVFKLEVKIEEVRHDIRVMRLLLRHLESMLEEAKKSGGGRPTHIHQCLPTGNNEYLLRPEYGEYSEAFSRAKETGRPMLLLWCVDGCAPCAKVNRHRAQLEARGHLVYLDAGVHLLLWKGVKLLARFPVLIIYRWVKGKWEVRVLYGEDNISAYSTGRNGG